MSLSHVLMEQRLVTRAMRRPLLSNEHVEDQLMYTDTSFHFHIIQLYSPFGRIKIKYKNSQTRHIIKNTQNIDILGYTENFIQQLLHITDKFTVNDSYYSAAVLISRQ